MPIVPNLKNSLKRKEGDYEKLVHLAWKANGNPSNQIETVPHSTDGSKSRSGGSLIDKAITKLIKSQVVMDMYLAA